MEYVSDAKRTAYHAIKMDVLSVITRLKIMEETLIFFTMEYIHIYTIFVNHVQVSAKLVQQMIIYNVLHASVHNVFIMELA